MSRAGLAALLAVAATAAPVHASAQRVEVLTFAGSTNRTSATTAAVTDPRVWYTITVTGVVSYNGRSSFADCGHRDESDEIGWHVVPQPYLDGTPSPCSRTPAHASHTYCWRQRGSGRRLTFDVRGFVPDDDAGGFVAVVTRGDPSAAPACPLLDQIG